MIELYWLMSKYFDMMLLLNQCFLYLLRFHCSIYQLLENLKQAQDFFLIDFQYQFLVEKASTTIFLIYHIFD